MATNWLQLLKSYVDTLETAVGVIEGATTLHNKLTAARAALLDQITALRMAELDAANLPADIDLIKGYTDSLETAVGAIEGATTLHNKLTAARAALLDQITALRLAELDAANLPADVDTLKAAVGAIEGATALHNKLTAARAALLDQITAARLGELDAANLPADIDLIKGYTDTLEGAIGAIEGATTLHNKLTAARAGYLNNLSAGAAALEATLTAIKGGGWATETLVAIKAAIDTIAGVNTYQEQIPDTDFSLAAIDVALTANPPAADAENSVVDIDAIGGSTFVLRSLFVNITSFGTGTKLTFKLWVPINAVITMVDSVDITATGIQNLMDIFGLQEVHADSIHITVQCDVGATGACSGTFKYAKAS